MALLSRPGAMPPWKHDDAEFGEDVRVCDVEVVLQGRDGDVATKLGLLVGEVYRH